MRMALQKFPHPPPQYPRPVPVNHADARQPRQKRAVQILFQLLGGFVDSAADEVDLHAHLVGVGAGHGHVHVLLLTSCGQRIGPFHDARLRRFHHFGNVVAFDPHLDGAESDFKKILLHFALHRGDFVHRLEPHLVAGRHVPHDVRLRIRVSLVGARAMRHHGLVEALLKLASQAQHAAFRFL